MKQQSEPATAGTMVPDLEGAPRSLSHATRTGPVLAAPPAQTNVQGKEAKP